MPVCCTIVSWPCGGHGTCGGGARVVDVVLLVVVVVVVVLTFYFFSFFKKKDGNLLKHVRHNAEEAEEMYMLCIREDSKHVDAMGNLANLYVEKGDFKKAKTTFERALKIKPNHEENKTNFLRCKKMMK